MAALTERRFRPWRWARENLFNTWYNAVLTLAILAVLVFLVRPLVVWMLTDARWEVIPATMKGLLTHTYPTEELWRIWTALALVMGLLGASGGLWGGLIRDAAVRIGAGTLLLWLLLMIVGYGDRVWLLGVNAVLFGALGAGLALNGRRRWRVGALGLWVLAPLLIVLLIGGIPGVSFLTPVGTSNWGGLMLTFLLAISGIVLSFPFGVLLALGRQSKLPAIRWVSVGYIELIRGVPLITVLFMMSIMLPFFTPPSIRPDLVVRAIAGFTLFTAAYIAENVRGGLQSIPTGQKEAAQALGLNAVLSTALIVLPQALRVTIPANVGQFITLFKDTSLVLIIPLMDLFTKATRVLENPDWQGPDSEMLLFVAAVYWVFAYFMSNLSRRLERNLGVGER